MKKILLCLFLLFTIFIFGCENVDLSKVSDKDLERISEQAIKCEKPYIRFGTSCCLDQNDNKICDRDEKIIEVIEPEDCGTNQRCFFEVAEPICKPSFLNLGIAYYEIKGLKDNECIYYQKYESKDMICEFPRSKTGKFNFSEFAGRTSEFCEGVLVEELFEKLLPTKCTLPAGIACLDHLATPEGIAIVLRNGLGYDIDQVSVDISGCGSGAGGVDFGTYLANGNKDTYAIGCSLTGSEFRGDISVHYRVIDTALTHLAKGTLSTTIEEDKSIDQYLPEKCILAPGLACVSHKVEPTKATLIVSNGLGMDIIVNSLFIGNCGSEYEGGLNIKNGGRETFVIDDCNYGKTQDKFEERITLIYTDKETGLTHEVKGRLSTRIE